MDFKDKVVVITGSTKGLGKALAVFFKRASEGNYQFSLKRRSRRNC